MNSGMTEVVSPDPPGYDWSAYVKSPDGNSHSYGSDDSGGSQGPAYPLQAYDASGLLNLGTALILPNGTRYNYTPDYLTFTSEVGMYGQQPASVIDTNGNQISLSPSGWTDTLNRLIPGSLINGDTMEAGVPTTDLLTCPSGTTSARVWDVPGIAGAMRRFKFCYSMFTIFTDFEQSTGFADYGPISTSLMSAVILPDLTMWTFNYDHYGDVTRLGLPTGGSISYTYQAGVVACASDNKSLWVTSRTVDANDGTGGHTWEYQYTTISNHFYAQGGFATVTSPPSPVRNDTVYTMTPGGGGCSAYVAQVDYYQGSSTTRTLLKTVQTQYNGNTNWSSASMNVVPKQTTVSWPGGPSTTIAYQYDQPTTDNQGWLSMLGSLLQKDEYDFANNLVRSTVNHYMWQDSNTYKTNNLISQRAFTLVKNASLCELAKTSYGYDETYLGNALQSSGISMQHVSPPAPVRANSTSTSRWLISNCAEQTAITSHIIPYDTGMPYQSYDPLNHMTQYTYDSTFYGAYLTQTNMPDTQNYANGPITHHVISGWYDFNTGLLTRFTDENSQNFTYTYDDMLRLTEGDHPDQGKTLFTYPDPNTVTRQQLVTNSPSNLWDTFTAKFDGLGRAYQTQHLTQGCTALTDTTYDSVGRVSIVSNPYCQGSNHQSDPTYGVTTTTYDALSRITQTQKQDGSISSASYNGTCTTGTDEAGQKRMVCNDALGRMTTVFEDPNGLNYETDYQYDLLNNVTRVDQKGSAPGDSSKWRTRLFTYDSLSRLITAYNPESGTICYGTWSGSNCTSGYDADGNLLSKTSPAVNQLSPSTATTVTSFAYDALNRVLIKSFTGNGYTDTTPTSVFGYDVPCCGVAPSNDIGRLAYGTYGNTELVYQYDTMGRPSKIADCPPSGIARGFCYAIAASYDKLGGVTSLSYPDGTITISYTPDSAGRMISAVDSANGINYVTSVTYGAASQLTGLANGSSIINTYQYNQRLQICRITASTTGLTPGDCINQGNTGDLLDLKYDFHIGNGTAGSGTDNGNIWSITNYKDTNRTQTFAYDALNRLASAQNAGANCAVVTVDGKTEYWGNSYTYDAWGNLTNKTITKCGAETINAPALNNNQLTGYTYDVAGNMVNDSSHGYTFDAENRIAKVDSTAATYTYNPLGNRVRKDAGSTSTEYFYFGSMIIVELNVSTSAWTNYVFFNGQRVARHDPSGSVFYYLADQVHSTSVIADSAGSLKAESDYYPWGGELQIVNNDPNNHYKFTSKERDSESQLDYFGARYYGNALSRFMTPDWDGKPATVPYAEFGDPQSLNLYSYVRNSPIVRVDANGHTVAGWDGMNADTEAGSGPIDTTDEVNLQREQDLIARTIAHLAEHEWLEGSSSYNNLTLWFEGKAVTLEVEKKFSLLKSGEILQGAFQLDWRTRRPTDSIPEECVIVD